MSNIQLAVPELKGSLQVVIRPGVDGQRDIGNTYEQSGGRWMAQPFRGIDFFGEFFPGGPLITTNNYKHPSGDYTSPTGGARWTGDAFGFGYALSWLNTFNPDPVLSPAAYPYRTAKTVGALGDFFHPKINVMSASFNKEVKLIDAVVNAEVAYQQKRLFDSEICVATGCGTGKGILDEPGTGPVWRSNVLQTTLRVDKQLRFTQKLLKTYNPTFSTWQVFDTSIQGFRNDLTVNATAAGSKENLPVSNVHLVENLGYGAEAFKHQTIATAVFVLSYMHGLLQPGIAGGAYLRGGDAFVIPSLTYSLGDHLRFRLESDIFLEQHQMSPSPTSYPPAALLTGVWDTQTRSIGPLANASQFLVRTTYQF